MGTTDQRVNITRNRILGKDDLGERGLDYLRGLVLEGLGQAFLKDVTFGDTKLGLSDGGNDKFDVDGTAIATDGVGHILDIANSGFASGIQFENESVVDYDVALGFAEVPAGVQVNPRNGLPEYVAFEEQIGESADPDTVTDNGNGTITFVVDSVTEVGVTNAGRKVRVFKKVPAKTATTEAIAVEELTVGFIGPPASETNQVTTAGALGQSTISTDAADYTVVLMGPTVKRGPDLENAIGFVFLGRVTGGGAGFPPSGFNTGGQDLFNFSFADLADFTRREVLSDRLKIDVKSSGADVLTDQIRVQDPTTASVFRVDGEGSMFATAVFSDLVPKSAFVLDLGSLVDRWDKAFLNDLDMAGDILSDIPSGAHAIGADSNRWFSAFNSRLALGSDGTANFPSPGTPDALNTLLRVRDTGFSQGGAAVDIFIDITGYDAPGGQKVALGVKLSGEVPTDLSSALQAATIELFISGNGDVTTAEAAVLTSGQAAGTADVATMSTLHLVQKSVISVTGDRHGLLVDDVPSAGVAGTAFAIKTGLGVVSFGDSVVVAGAVNPDFSFVAGRTLGDFGEEWKQAHAQWVVVGEDSGAPPALTNDDALRIRSERPNPASAGAMRYGIDSVVSQSGLFAAALEDIVGHSNFISTKPASGTVNTMIGAEIDVDFLGTGTSNFNSQVGVRVKMKGGIGSGVQRGIDIQSPSGASVAQAIGIHVNNIFSAVNNWAILTGSGLVEFRDTVKINGGSLIGAGTVEVGEDLHPDAAGLDIGGVAAADRWEDVFCRQVHADAVPVAELFEDTTFRQLTAGYVLAQFDSNPILRGGMAVSATPDGIVTVPNNGVYRVTYTIPIGDDGGVTSNPSVAQGKCVKNSATTPVDILQSFSQAAISVGNSRPAITTSFLVSLSASDTIEVQVQQRDVADGVPANFAGYPNLDAVAQEAYAQLSVEAVSITD